MDQSVFDTSELSNLPVRKVQTLAPRRAYLENVKFNQNQNVVFSVSKAISTGGGAVGLKGRRASDGATVKIAGTKTLQLSCVTGESRSSLPHQACGESMQDKAEPAHRGTVTQAGGKAEVVCYAYI